MTQRNYLFLPAMKYKFVPGFLSDALTPFYDIVVHLGGLGKSFQKKVLKIADLKDRENVLDVGCGTGTFDVLAKTLHPHTNVVGIDADERILRIARKKVDKSNTEVELIQAWAEDLPFRPSSFDVVVSALTFHHLPTQIKKKALKEIYRVLKKNGRFVLADIGKPDNLFDKIKFMLDPERLWTGEYMKDNLEGKLALLVKEAGFTVREIIPRHRGIQFLLAKKG